MSKREFISTQVLSGQPFLRRAVTQKALDYCELWPLETRWALQEFSMICTLLGVELVADGDKVFLTQIKIKEI